MGEARLSGHELYSTVYPCHSPFCLLRSPVFPHLLLQCFSRAASSSPCHTPNTSQQHQISSKRIMAGSSSAANTIAPLMQAETRGVVLIKSSSKTRETKEMSRNEQATASLGPYRKTNNYTGRIDSAQNSVPMSHQYSLHNLTDCPFRTFEPS